MVKRLRAFQRVFNIDDFMTADFTTTATPIYNRIGAFTVPAQQQIAWGFGGTGGGVDTRGQVYIKIWVQGRDTSAIDAGFIFGKIRLAISDANETDIRVIVEERTERLNADISDRTKAVLLGESRERAGEDSLLIIYYKPDESNAEVLDINGTNSQMLLPVTVYQ